MDFDVDGEPVAIMDFACLDVDFAVDVEAVAIRDFDGEPVAMMLRGRSSGLR